MLKRCLSGSPAFTGVAPSECVGQPAYVCRYNVQLNEGDRIAVSGELLLLRT